VAIIVGPAVAICLVSRFGKKDATFTRQGQSHNNCRPMVSAAIHQQLLQSRSLSTSLRMETNIKNHLERRVASN